MGFELQRLAAAALDPAVQVSPTYLSATGLVRLTRDPDGFLTESGRPMPKRPVAAQRLGTRFHRWLEQRFALAPSSSSTRGWSRATTRTSRR